MSTEYTYPVLKVTKKQIEKHALLCSRFDCSARLPQHEIVESEEEAELVGTWYGKGNPERGKPGIMYITIFPDGSSSR